MLLILCSNTTILTPYKHPLNHPLGGSVVSPSVTHLDMYSHSFITELCYYLILHYSNLKLIKTRYFYSEFISNILPYLTLTNLKINFYILHIFLK